MNIRVERKGYNIALIEWDASGVVKLYKQNTDASEPVLLAETSAGIHIDEDDHLEANNPLYYVVQGDSRSLPARVDSQGDNYQYNIVDNYLWQLRVLPRGFAVKGYLKTENSNYCPECYNTTLKKTVKTVCNTCDGSGMIESYKGPIVFYIAISSRKKEKIYDEMKERNEDTIHAWTANIPYLKQGDILAFNGLLYVVQYTPGYMYSPSENDGKPFMVRQEFILVRLDRNNSMYEKILGL